MAGGRPLKKTEEQRAAQLIKALAEKEPTADVGKYAPLLGALSEAKPDLSFKEFIKLLVPNFQFHRPALAMIKEIEDVIEGKTQFLQIWLPPRYGKSLLISRLAAAYYLYRYPTRFVGLWCHSVKLAEGHSLAARQYLELAGGKVSKDASAKEMWETDEGGGMWARSTGASPLGLGYGLGLIDDPHGGPKELHSVTEQENLHNNYNTVFATRENLYAEHQPSQILIMQRWASNDLAQWLIDQSAGDEEEGVEPIKWRILALDAIKSDEPFKIPEWCELAEDWREQPGEVLEESVHTLAKLKRIRKRDPFYFAAQYQQRPLSLEGEFCSATDFNVLDPDDKPPNFKTLVRGWDIAVTQGGGDYTVGALLGITSENDLYILDIIRERLAGPNVRQLIKQTMLLERQGTIVAAEKAGNSISIIQDLVRDPGLNNMPFFPIPITASSGPLKFRALGLFGKIKGGQVFVANKKWTKDLLNEFCSFDGSPNKHDDIISAVNIALTAATQKHLLGQISEEDEPYHPGTIGWLYELAGIDIRDRLNGGDDW